MQLPTTRDETHRFLDAWFATRQAVHALHFNRFHQDGLSGTQFMAMTYLAEKKASIRLSALAERLTLTPSTIARVVDAMVRRGLVVKETAATDARVKLVRLSQQGRRMQKDSQRAFEASIAAIFGRLTDPEREGLVRGLEAFVRATDISELRELEKSHER